AKVKVFIELFQMRHRVARQAEEQAKREAAEEAARQSAFLAGVSAALANAMDLDAVLGNLVRLPVPYLADLCAVTLADDQGRAGRTNLAWAGPTGEATVPPAGVSLGPSFERLTEAIDQVLATGRRHFL